MAQVELVPVHNAADEQIARQGLLMAGPIGVGKTLQLLTLPGRKFGYFFDPNALATIKMAPIEDQKRLDYLEFLPDLEDLDIAAQTLRGAADTGGVVDKSGRPVRDLPTLQRVTKKKPEPKLYTRWEEDFEARIASGFFNDYDWIAFDSLTSFADMIYDRIMWMNGRLGKHPEQADHTAQMNVVKSIFRLATAQDRKLYVTAHTETYRDDLSGRVYGRIMLTGRNRIRIPALFSNIYGCIGDGHDFFIVTKSNREFPVIRCTVPGLKDEEKVTLQLNSRLESKQGVGKLVGEYIG